MVPPAGAATPGEIPAIARPLPEKPKLPSWRWRAPRQSARRFQSRLDLLPSRPLRRRPSRRFQAGSLRYALRPGGGGVTVGDIAEESPKVLGDRAVAVRRLQRTATAERPKNIDFKPYLLQVLAVVKRHWLSVIPDSARHGRRGVVVLKFAIDRRGSVPQLEFTNLHGTDFDRAAIAGISASVPFPPFPAGFNGDQIRLQMAFAYNQVPH